MAKDKKEQKKLPKDFIAKNILFIIGFVIILIVALALIFYPKAGLTGGVVGEKQTAKDCGEGTIFYGVDTGLCWQRSVMPGTADSWYQAESYCENLELAGKDNWRLPSLEELRKIVKKGDSSPSIDQSYFQDTQSRHYWTSTTYPNIDGTHKYIHFENGYEGYNFDMNSGYGVRCVRTNSVI